MSKAINQAISRIKNTRRSSYLTKGSDDYDHKGLNKARRAYGKALINEIAAEANQADENATEVKKEASATYRVVISTQVYENYGAHDWDETGDCPQYWKAKGGNEYVRNVGTIQDVLWLGPMGLHSVAAELGELVFKNNESWREYMISWCVLSDTEESSEERDYREMVELGYASKETAKQALAARFK